MIKDVWFRGAATCMGPRERYSPGPSLTLNGPARGRPKISWMDNIKTWTGLEPGNLLRAEDDRLQWRSIVHGFANPRIEDG